jgi:hypothetical protein
MGEVADRSVRAIVWFSPEDGRRSSQQADAGRFA